MSSTNGAVMAARHFIDELCNRRSSFRCNLKLSSTRCPPEAVAELLFVTPNSLPQPGQIMQSFGGKSLLKRPTA
jgi:hypothetical protein